MLSKDIKNKGYRFLFLDTCVLSNIGRMKKDRRANLAFDLLVNKKYCIVISVFHIIEIERTPDKELRNNIYDFLQLSLVGFAKNRDNVMEEEIKNYYTSGAEIIEFTCSMLAKGKNGEPFDFKSCKDVLLKNIAFIEENEKHNIVMLEVQKYKRSLPEPDTFFDLIVFKYIYDLDKGFLKTLNGEFIDFNKIKAFISWSYSYAHKIESGAIKKNAQEINDVSMSYIAPYMDRVIIENKQYSRYMELIQKKKLSVLSNLVIEKSKDVTQCVGNEIIVSI